MSGGGARTDVGMIEELVLDGSSDTMPVPVYTCQMDSTAAGRDEWCIDALMLGDGYQHNTKVMKGGHWYGCANIHSGVESYYRVSAASFSITESQTRATSFPTKVLHPMLRASPRAVVVPNARATRSGSFAMRSALLRETILAFCKKHPGVAVLQGGPGNRCSNPELVPYFDSSWAMLKTTSSDMDYAQAAVVNGIAILCGIESHKRAVGVFDKWKPRIANLGQLGPAINKMSLNLQLCRPKSLVRLLQKGRYTDTYNIIAGFTGGLWLVRLVHFGARRVDHCVLVNADSRVILISEEGFPIRLTAHSLRRCGGPRCPRLQVAQVMELKRAK